MSAVHDRLGHAAGADVRAFAEAIGLTRARERGKWACPSCPSSDALSLRAHPGDGRLAGHCHSCGQGYDAVALVQAALGGSHRDALVACAEVVGAWDVLAELEAPSERERHAPIPRRPPREAPPPTYPDASEVTAVWESAEHVTCDAAAARYLAGRRIDPEQVWRRDLARVLTSSSPSYRWMRFGSRSWLGAGYRMVVPVYNARGVMRALRAWRLDGRGPKRVAPAGGSTSGLVMADIWGVGMLRGEGQACDVLIAEGEPDYVLAASRWRLLASRPTATLGVVSGSWTREIASRVPDGATVMIATHEDEAGDRYARDIAATLDERYKIERAELRRAA